jgi:hypothetical protein
MNSDSVREYFKNNQKLMKEGYRIIWTQWEEEETINIYCLSYQDYLKFKKYQERTNYGIWGNCDNIRLIDATSSKKELTEYDMISDEEMLT